MDFQRRHQHEPASLQQPDPTGRTVRSARPDLSDDVRLRADGLQLRAHRQRPRPGGVRGARRAAASPLRPTALCAQHHRRRRQDQRGGQGTRYADLHHYRQVRGRVSRRHGRAGRERRFRAGHRAVRDRAHPADDRDDPAPDRRRPRLRCRRPRAVRGGHLRRLRQAVAPRPGGHDRRCPRRSRAVQAQPRRFRAVETLHRRPARLGIAVECRPSGLAYRMLGDGRSASGRDHRHPRRRRRPAVPASRKRSRAERMRAWRKNLRQLVAAQRHAELRRQQDGQVGRQHPARPRPGPRAPA